MTIWGRVVVLALWAFNVVAQVSYQDLLNAEATPENWLTYSGTYKSQHYSGLKQITRENVGDLEFKWAFHASTKGKLQGTPLVVDGVMYLTEGNNDVSALDAKTGRRFWTYSHILPKKVHVVALSNRGAALLDERVFTGTLDGRLVALDAKAGHVLWNRKVCEYTQGYHPCIRAAIEATKKGWLGDAYLLRATMNSNRSKQGRTIEAKYPGGAFFELCGHMVDRAVELWGRPLKTTGFLRHDTSEPDDLKDNTLAVLEYDKSMAVISTAAKMANAGAHRSFELIGTEGSFFIQPIAGDRTMRVNMSKARGPYKEGWQDIKFEPHPYDKFEFEDMARAIRTREPLEYSYDHELLVHETLLRASGHNI